MTHFCSFVPSSLLWWGGWGIIVSFYSVQILNKINEKSELPLPHCNDAKRTHFCSFTPSLLLWGGWGIIVSFYSVQLLNKINEKSEPPLPHFNDARRTHFCSFTPSSLLWWGWGIIVSFYSVQDCSLCPTSIPINLCWSSTWWWARQTTTIIRDKPSFNNFSLQT